MNRNSMSRFDLAPQVHMGRSKFDRSHSLKTSFNVGDLVPIFVDEVLPGDEFEIKTSKVLRLQTLITPVMDNLYCDVYYFFVPNRLVWEHWQQLMGENTDSAWIPQTEYSVPQIEAPSGGWNIGTIADYFGIPTGVDNISVNAMPFRAYALIMQEWFRDENNTLPLNIPLTDSTVTGVNTGNYVDDTAKGGLPFKAAKYHDYFTSALPAPQKGPDVTVPMANEGISPVYTIGDINSHYYSTGMKQADYGSAIDNAYPLLWENGAKNWNNSRPYPFDMQTKTKTVLQPSTWQTIHMNAEPLTSGSQGTNPTLQGSIDGTGSHTPVNVKLSGISDGALTPLNLVADNNLTYTSINQLRLAFQIQKLYERDARGGTRYIELLRSHFGVISPDARLQRPEYLGGNRFPFNVNQVTQTSSTDSTTPQGNVAAYSLTADVSFDFHKGFVEHGHIIGIACVRYEHTYQQGIERMWSRKGRFDFYWPSLALIGEQKILNKELLAQGTTDDDEVFGYQEAWAEYRFKTNRITGSMRSADSGALDSWHFGDYYASLPTLSDGWIREDKTNVDRALAVTSSTANQIFGDFYFKTKVIRPMPLYSVPGLIDHF